MRIIYIDIDTTRADHLGCYGYHRNTSPHIDQVAAEGVRFDQFFTPDAPCLPSRAALYTGQFGIQSGIVGHGGTAADPKIEGRTRGFRDRMERHGLVRQLQKHGLRTVLISPFGQRHSAHWFHDGFNEIYNTGQGGAESAETLRPVFEKWLKENVACDNYYLHINLWDPHTPYRAPASMGEPFKNDPLPQWLNNEKLIQQHNKMAGPHTSLEISMYNDKEEARFPRQPGKVTDLASMRRLIDGYDTGILYADQQVGYIIQQLKAAGVYEDTAIIISSDHGENFGELGIYAEHGTADAITCRIPFIVKWPGGKKGAVAPGFQYNLDWAPTLMDLLGRDKPAAWDGRSFATTIKTGNNAGREELILSQCCHVCQRSVRWDRWLYVHTYHDGFHLFPREMVFDIAADPHEQNDLADSEPAIRNEGAWRLARWHNEQMQKMAVEGSDVVDPLWTVVREGGPFHAQHGDTTLLTRYIARLEATGRAEGAKALREKYACFLPAAKA
jgi:arylsulfatase A-like enzyme